MDVDRTKVITWAKQAAKGAGLNPSEIEFELLRYPTASPSDLFTRALSSFASWDLMDSRWEEAARRLILYRIYEERGQHPPEKLEGLESWASWVGLNLLYERYLVKRGGRVVETPNEMLERVASFVAGPELSLGGHIDSVRQEFYEIMSSGKFMPNSPTLMNSGTKYHQLAACFVIPVEDDMDSIFSALNTAAWIFKTGAGAGFDFTPLRGRGAPLSFGGTASGPVSFMRLFDEVADVIKEGGRRRAAMMGVLHDTHIDLEDFINSKLPGGLENFNISVGVHDAFIMAAVSGSQWNLYDPSECPQLVGALSGDLADIWRRCKPKRSVSATEVLNEAVRAAWESGDPGLVFLDTINEHNPTPRLGRIRATNPCGETPLLSHEACNLGSINLGRFIKDGSIDWELLEHDIRVAVRFLDDVIEASWYPRPEIEAAVKRNRKVGLGVMGWADMLAELKVPYDSDSALFLADKLMEFIAYVARDESNRLSAERGPYPEFPGSIHKEGRFNFEPQLSPSMIYDESKVSEHVHTIVESRPKLDWDRVRLEMIEGTRNATVTTIAPTGSISIIANASSSIEPFYSLVYIRQSSLFSWIEVNRFLKDWLESSNNLTPERVKEIIRHGGSVRGLDWVPKEYQDVLTTALDMDWRWHVKMQAVFQRWVDNAVSKTVNMRKDATLDDVKGVFLEAWRLKCKGITVFRDQSKGAQVLKVSGDLDSLIKEPPALKIRAKARMIPGAINVGDSTISAVSEEYAGGCPTCDL
jgi:ribonucleoside-diphosphate reductase alpha chain